MKKLNLKEARKVLPHGSMGELSKRTGICTTDISRIFNGLECKKNAVVETEVINYLRETNETISQLLIYLEQE